MNYLKVLFNLGLFIISINAYSQNVTGPKMKNSKPWDRKSTVLVVKADTENLIGPNAKNAKPWAQESDSTTQVQMGKYTELTGPEMKNIALLRKRNKEIYTEVQTSAAME